MAVHRRLSPARRSSFSRRAFLSRSGALGAAGLLASCGATNLATERSPGGASTLQVINWPDYIPMEAIDQIEREVDQIAIIEYDDTRYLDNVTGFDDIIEPALSGGGVPDFDLIVPTQWLAGRMIDMGWVEALPLEIIPNHVNLDPRFTTNDFDRGSRFQMPWQGGITGISYDPDQTGGEITSIEQLLDNSNSDLAGRVGLIGEMREAVGLAMLVNGDDPARPSFDTASAGLNLLFELADAGHFQSVVFDDFADELEAGRLAATMAWSGVAADLQTRAPRFEFVIPDEGAISWFDTMVIPRNAQAFSAAAGWMNWAYNPANAALITAFTLFVCPVLGTQQALRDMGLAEVAANPLIFPDTETRNRLSTWGALDLPEEVAIEARFDELTDQIGFAN